MPTHDALVIGAAPAGSIAALILARAGKRVLLIDRAAFPRSKICGNCINPGAWQIWSSLGLTEAFSALPHQQLTGFDIHCEGRRLHRLEFSSAHQAPRAVSRAILDDWLRREAQAAGAEFLPETIVTSIHPDSATIQTTRGEFSGRLIIGADGRNSLIARQSGLMPPPRRCHRVGWQTSIAAPASLDDHVHMHLFEEGYFGLCRTSPTLAVLSMVLDSRRTQDPLLLARRFLPSFEPNDWLRINPIARAPARLGRGRVWLAGDAARVVEPFTGEGILFALTTGLLAAESALAGFAAHDLDHAFAIYARQHRRLYRRRAWVNTLMRWTLTTPSHVVRLARHLDRLPGIVSFLSHRVHATS